MENQHGIGMSNTHWLNPNELLVKLIANQQYRFEQYHQSLKMIMSFGGHLKSFRGDSEVVLDYVKGNFNSYQKHFGNMILETKSKIRKRHSASFLETKSRQNFKFRF